MRRPNLPWLLLLLPNLVAAQQVPFLFMPGGPTNVQTIFQDHLGRMWVGGQSDVACFDGSRFYSLHDLGFPASIGATAFAEDQEGAIWIGSEVGLFRFQHGHLNKIAPGWVTALAASSGVLVAAIGAAEQGRPQQPFLFSFHPDQTRWTSEKILRLAGAGLLTIDHSANLILPYKNGWAESSVKAIAAWHTGSPLPIIEHASQIREPARYLRDRFGCLWSRSEDGTTYQCPGQQAPTELPDFSASFLFSMWEDSAGTMIFENDAGVVMGRPGHFQTITGAQGLPDVDSAITAADGTVWLGGANGIYRWPQPLRLEYWTPRDGANGTWGLSRIGTKIFSGNGQEGIQVLSDNRTRWLPLPKSNPLGQVMDLIPDEKGGLLAGLRAGGVAEVQTDGTIGTTARLPAITVAKLFRNLDGQVWAAGIGIHRVQFLANRILLQPEKLPDNRPIVVDIHSDPRTGKLFACWEGGLLHKEPEGWRKITTADGLREDRCRTLAVLPNGDVWVGYATLPGFALVRIAPSGKVTVRNYPSRWKGGATSLCFLDVDSRGWLWRGTQDGLYVADPAAAEKGQWIRLDELDGLPDSDFNQQGFYKDPDGSVWWMAADHSITHFRPPDDFVHPAFAPKVFISSFSSNGGPPKLSDTLDTAPHSAALTAHIGSLQFDRRNALHLRYRVLPEQSAWQDARDLDLPLGVLGWGNHRLEVEASLGTGPWSALDSHSFKVLRPFWATWPFLVCFFAAASSVAFAVYRMEQRWRAIERRALPDLASLRVDAVAPEAGSLIGHTLNGRFVPNRVLAPGGFSTVFDGHDQKQNRRCAIKVFHREVADQGLARRFAQEVAALETVVHPNVVRIYGYGEAPSGVPYLVMEFIEGQTLRDAIPSDGFPPATVATLLRQAGQALTAIHSYGICHRDLKPENLMLRDGHLVLIDFSIAIVKSPDKTVHGLSHAAGTIQYMAPEQAIGWADLSSDIYSLAKVAMEMLTGKRLTELLPQASRDLPQQVRDFLTRSSLGTLPNPST